MARAGCDSRVVPDARVAVFGPNPLLTVMVERAADGRDEVHLHAGGQGVWVARMAAELGAAPILCGLTGGEAGRVLGPLLDDLGAELRLVETAGGTGTYVMDRRDGERRLVALAPGTPAARHELDDLMAATCVAALDAGLLVVCNAFPADAVPDALYGDLVGDARANGVRTLIDLSPPRLDAALRGRPDLVKLNDWELAQFIRGPVDTPARLRGAVERLRDAGASSVVVTRGEHGATWFDGDDVWHVEAPRFAHGWREGCGDAMTGAMAAVLSSGRPAAEAIRTGAAAGAANFLRRGLGTGRRAVVEDLAAHVTLHHAA